MPGQDFDAVFVSPVGRLGIRVEDGALCRLEFLSGHYRLRTARCADTRRLQRSILAFFADPRAVSGIECRLSGTAFQCRVWRALRRIPAGKTMTYGGMAERLGTSARAVGNACRHNPVPIVVPCHRVVARHGPGGFAGDRQGRLVQIKQQLLYAEGVEIRG